MSAESIRVMHSRIRHDGVTLHESSPYVRITGQDSSATHSMCWVIGKQS